MRKLKTAIACVGDSITAGNPGVSFIRYMKQGTCLNYGRGGDTLKGVLHRAADIKPSGRVLLGIGTNDILIPFLLARSPFWNLTARRLFRRGSTPTKNAAQFRAEFEKLLELLGPGKSLVMSIPCIGENLDSVLNKKVLEYNSSISSLCKTMQIPFIDINTMQRESIKEGTSSDYLLGGGLFRLIADAILAKVGRSMNLSGARGLRTTIDGVHFNSYFAGKIGNALDKYF